MSAKTTEIWIGTGLNKAPYKQDLCLYGPPMLEIWAVGRVSSVWADCELFSASVSTKIQWNNSHKKPAAMFQFLFATTVRSGLRCSSHINHRLRDHSLSLQGVWHRWRYHNSKKKQRIKWVWFYLHNCKMQILEYSKFQFLLVHCSLYIINAC